MIPRFVVILPGLLHNPRQPIQGEHNGRNARTSRLPCSPTPGRPGTV